VDSKVLQWLEGIQIHIRGFHMTKSQY